MSPSLVNLLAGNALTASALLVQFGANARADTVFVGTGEPGDLTMLPAADRPSYLGIGVRVSPGAAGGARAWHLEAATPARPGDLPPVPGPRRSGRGLGGGEHRAVRPAQPVRPEHGVDADRHAGAGNLLPGGREITDVVITGTTAAANKRIFAAARGGNVAAAAPGRPASTSRPTTASTWNAVPITPNSAANPGRIALAVSDTANQVVYRFDELGRLWRFDGARPGACSVSRRRLDGRHARAATTSPSRCSRAPTTPSTSPAA